MKGQSPSRFTTLTDGSGPEAGATIIETVYGYVYFILHNKINRTNRTATVIDRPMVAFTQPEQLQFSKLTGIFTGSRSGTRAALLPRTPNQDLPFITILSSLVTLAW